MDEAGIGWKRVKDKHFFSSGLNEWVYIPEG